MPGVVDLHQVIEWHEAHQAEPWRNCPGCTPVATRDVDPETTTVLAGAGPSADAGVPVAYALFDEIVDSLVAARKFASVLKSMARPGVLPHGAFIRFETLLLWVAEIFDDGLGVLAFLDAYHQPGPIHLALVEAECRVFTVNFDDLFEQAAAAQGRQALTVDTHQPPLTITDPAVFLVWRLHGTRRIHTPEGVFRADQIPQATTSAIAAASPGVTLGEQARKAFTDALDGNTLLVVGYSASDDLDGVPALLDVTPSRLVWVDHADTLPAGFTPAQRSRVAPHVTLPPTSPDSPVCAAESSTGIAGDHGEPMRGLEVSGYPS